MADLADNYGGIPVFLKDAARREEISEKYLSLIVIPLRNSGLISSTRGARGGYSLARRPEEISVLEVLQALEGEICLVDCVKNAGGCSRISTCPTRDIWGKLGEQISETLRSVSLADLVRIRRAKADNNLSNHI
jgi:Rrf2 family protein